MRVNFVNNIHYYGDKPLFQAEEVLLQTTHCFSLRSKQPMIPKGKRATARQMAEGGQLSSRSPPQQVQLLPRSAWNLSWYLTRHFPHQPYITLGGSPALSSALHSHLARIRRQKRHFPHPQQTRVSTTYLMRQFKTELALCTLDTIISKHSSRAYSPPYYSQTWWSLRLWKLMEFQGVSGVWVFCVHGLCMFKNYFFIFILYYSFILYYIFVEGRGVWWIFPLNQSGNGRGQALNGKLHKFFLKSF